MTTEERTELINQLAYVFAYGRAVALQDVMESIDEKDVLETLENESEPIKKIFENSDWHMIKIK